jgi:hypothetical protein
MSEDTIQPADVASEVPEITRGRVTLEAPQPKKSRHVRSPAQQQALQKAREKAHTMLRGSKWVVEHATAHQPMADSTIVPVSQPDHIDRRMTELVAITRLQMENERLARKVAKYRERSSTTTQATTSQPQTISAYDNLIMAEIKRLSMK